LYHGQLAPILTAIRTVLDLLVMSVVYMANHLLSVLSYCLSTFSKCNFGICCHLLCIQTDV